MFCIVLSVKRKTMVDIEGLARSILAQTGVAEGGKTTI